METVKLNIDGREIETQKGKSVLQASLEAGIYIPHLCFHPDLTAAGACRLCVVEIEGMEGLPASCATLVTNGMVVRTKTEKTQRLRQWAMELLLAGHPADCSTCIKYLNCELQSIKQYLAGESSRFKNRARLFPANTDNPLFLIDPNRCVLCGRCVRACQDLRGVGVLYYKKRGPETYIGTADDLPLADSGCRFCGACAEVCPTGAIMDKDEFTRSKNRKKALIPCRYTCPAEIDVPGYIRFIREKDYTSALALIREVVPFPQVLGYVCDHPCEAVCRRGAVNQPVSIRELKRFAGQQGKEGWQKNRSIPGPHTGKKAAIIGSGPAGLTAAWCLAQKGHTVTVFESLPQAGGMLRYGIPDYRLPKSVLDEEIKSIADSGIEIKTNQRIESIDKLFEMGYQAILAAVGTHKGSALSIPGADNPGVLMSVDFLRAVNSGHPPHIGEMITVLGGGNVAFDCARVARRLGAKQVQIACLEAADHLPASSEEIELASQEGITIYPSRTFAQILNDRGIVSGIKCLEVASFGFDEDKKLQVEVRENSEHVLEADTVIMAIGQRPEIPEGFGLATSPGSLIELDPFTLATSRDGVFAAGDAVTGTSSVINAIASGRKAAAALDRFLGGDGDIGKKSASPSEIMNYLGRREGFAALKREEIANISPEERLKNFAPVIQDMDVGNAECEAGRCLQCDLRSRITRVKFWGDY